MTNKKDDLEAVRVIAEALDGFDPGEQERILRWSRERVGLSVATPTALTAASLNAPQHGVPGAPPTTGTKDLKSFITEKNPRSDVQFAAAVAYYYQFEAPQSDRKTQINSDDLKESCRLVNRERLQNPGQTLRNAHQQGILDKGGEAGMFTINSVGENLVAMIMPTGQERVKGLKKKKTAKRGKK